MDIYFIASLAIGLALFLMFTGLVLFVGGRSFAIEARLTQLAPRSVTVASAARNSRANQPTGRASRFLSANASPDLATELARADLHLTPPEYMALNLLSMVLGFALSFLIFHQNLLLALFGAVVGILAPRWYLRYLQRKRLTAFNNQLGDTIVLLANSLRSGYSLLQSMETVTKEMAPPVSVEFTRLTREVGLGLTIHEAMANLLRRVPSDDLDFMITAINVNHEVGGNLSEILDTIAHTIRERVRIMGEIRSITAQQRLSAVILSLLPIVLGLIIYALNPSYIAGLWSNLCGWVMLVVSGSLIVIGYLLIRRIATIEV